jgi:hypothetical protein
VLFGGPDEKGISAFLTSPNNADRRANIPEARKRIRTERMIQWFFLLDEPV